METGTIEQTFPNLQIKKSTSAPLVATWRSAKIQFSLVNSQIPSMESGTFQNFYYKLIVAH